MALSTLLLAVGLSRIIHGNPKLRHNLHQQMVVRLSCPERRALKPDAQASGRIPPFLSLAHRA